MQTICELISSVHYTHRVLIVFTLLTVAAFQPAAGQSFISRDLGTLPGGNVSQAIGINERGQVIGYSFIASGDQHATLFGKGILTNLGLLPGGENCAANAINNRGQVVGWSTASENNEHAFLFEHGVMTDLGMLPGGNQSIARQINNRSQVVGYSATRYSPWHAVLWTRER
jgi:probable HAF family extracellular repeat protein